ncbi:hypothetical protein LSH36_630g01056 [Paralvinella palmiformis]|uniref:Uncharacterized protein n=1 Tax=Paralvinella palmiformis TaxID=53620 RepID=A0AAD9J5A8_9ANNE|nr:hypothetical protein LSH36_630g01056 [Paralvinella palmiformis]
MMRLNHVTLQITEEGSSTFVLSEESKMQRYNIWPNIKLGKTYRDNIWVCYSLDWIVIVLLVACFAILSSTVIIANNYYNTRQEYRREVEPFCRPQLFNPFGQISMGQAIAFVGICLKTTVHGNITIEWQDYWISVWVAILPMASGAVTAIALKRVGLSKHKLLVIIGAVLQFITLIVTIAAIVISTIALSDNIKALNPGPMATTSYSKSLLTASVFMFAINDIVLLVGLIYALALFIRLIAEGCKKEDQDPLNEKRYHSEDRYQSQLRPFSADRYPLSFGRDKPYLGDGADMIREAVDARY